MSLSNILGKWEITNTQNPQRHETMSFDERLTMNVCETFRRPGSQMTVLMCVKKTFDYRVLFILLK